MNNKTKKKSQKAIILFRKMKMKGGCRGLQMDHLVLTDQKTPKIKLTPHTCKVCSWEEEKWNQNQPHIKPITSQNPKVLYTLMIIHVSEMLDI